MTNFYITKRDTGEIYKFKDVTEGLVSRFNSCGNSLNKVVVLYTIDRMDKILNKYLCKKERKDGVWTYYKRIPSRYWHEMRDAYVLFSQIIGSSHADVGLGDCGGVGVGDCGVGVASNMRLFNNNHVNELFDAEDKKKMKLYINLLPGLAQFDKCKEHNRFNVFRRTIYDHFHCLVD